MDAGTEPPPGTDAGTEPPPMGGPLLTESGDLAAGAEVRYTVTAPMGSARLTFTMETAGDADLYVSQGEPPTRDSYDCRPYEAADSTEVCEFAPPGLDTYHVMVRGYSEAVFELVATVE